MAAGAARLHPFAHPNLLFGQQFVCPGLNHGLLCQLGLFLALVGRVIAWVRQQTPPIKLDDSRGNFVQKAAIVGDDDHAGARLNQQVFKPLDAVKIQMIGGLVQQQNVGLLHQSLGQRNALGGTAGKLRNPRMGVEAQSVQRLFYPLLPTPTVARLNGVLQKIQVAFAQRVTVNPCDHLRQALPDSFMHGPFRGQHRLLLYQSQTYPLLQLQLPVIRLFKARQNAHQRGLASSVATNQAHPLKGLQ